MTPAVAKLYLTTVECSVKTPSTSGEHSVLPVTLNWTVPVRGEFSIGEGPVFTIMILYIL